VLIVAVFLFNRTIRPVFVPPSLSGNFTISPILNRASERVLFTCNRSLSRSTMSRMHTIHRRRGNQAEGCHGKGMETLRLHLLHDFTYRRMNDSCLLKRGGRIVFLVELRGGKIFAAIKGELAIAAQ
jgi:hypothetical protein